MIKSVRAQNFKHGTFEVDLEHYNLVIGPNGSGKSAITEALMIVLMDYVPGIAKMNQDILSEFATNTLGKVDNLSLAIVDDSDVCIGKKFEQTEKGVTQKYFVGTASTTAEVSKEEFLVKRAEIGSPTVFDIKKFWADSDAKKIDTLFSVFPSEDKDIDKKISNEKTKINTLHDKHRTCKKVAKELNESKASAEDYGSLSDINHELVKLEAEKKLVQRAIYQEEARIKAEESEKNRQQAVKDVQDIFPGSKVIKEPSAPKPPQQNPGVSNRAGIQDGGLPTSAVGVVESIQKIIDAIKRVGCKTCINGAGMMIAKSELKKYKGGNLDYGKF